MSDPIPTDLDRNGVTDAADLDLAISLQDEASSDYRIAVRRAMADRIITPAERASILMFAAKDRQAADTIAAVTITLAHLHARI